MEIDVRAIAQKLINEFDMQQLVNKARAEGVSLLYERIREATEQQRSESVEHKKSEASAES